MNGVACRRKDLKFWQPYDLFAKVGGFVIDHYPHPFASPSGITKNEGGFYSNPIIKI